MSMLCFQLFSISLNSNLLWVKLNLPRITISKNPDQIKNNPHKFPIYWTCSAQCLISNARPNKKVLVIYFPFCVTSN